MIPYEEIEPPKLQLPPRQPADPEYVRPPIESMSWVPSAF